MTTLYGRSLKLVVGQVSIEAGGANQLRVTFKIEKGVSPVNPNTCEIEVYNLSENTRRLLDGEKTPRLPIRLEAGYTNDRGTVFVGTTVSLAHAKQPTGWLTKIRATDGSEVKAVVINRSFAPGTTAQTVIDSILDDVKAKVQGFSVAGFRAAVAKDKVGGAITYTRGFLASGSADEVLRKLCAQAEHDLVLQDGSAEIVPKGGSLPREAVLLSPTSGLVGSPEMARDQLLTLSTGEVKKATLGKQQPNQQQGVAVIRARSLMNHRIVPRSLVQIRSASPGLTGQIIVLHAAIDGDTHGASWHVDLEGKAA